MVSDFVPRRKFCYNELMVNPPAWQYGHYGGINTDQRLHDPNNVLHGFYKNIAHYGTEIYPTPVTLPVP